MELNCRFSVEDEKGVSVFTNDEDDFNTHVVIQENDKGQSLIIDNKEYIIKHVSFAHHLDGELSVFVQVAVAP